MKLSRDMVIKYQRIPKHARGNFFIYRRDKKSRDERKRSEKKVETGLNKLFDTG